MADDTSKKSNKKLLGVALVGAGVLYWLNKNSATDADSWLNTTAATDKSGTGVSSVSPVATTTSEPDATSAAPSNFSSFFAGLVQRHQAPDAATVVAPATAR